HTVIVKLHGGALDAQTRDDSDNFVVTEDDHIGYLDQGIEEHVPLQVLRKMRESHFLFLGYHVGDWATRVFLQRLWGEHRLKATSWAIDSDLAPGEPELWQQLGIGVISKPPPDFVDGIRRAVDRPYAP